MGLNDRDYMRPAENGFADRLRRAFTRATAVHWTVGVLTLAFILEVALDAAGHGGFILRNLALTSGGLRSGKVWEIATYGLLHTDLWHLFFNALGLWFIGTGLLDEQGPKKFLKVLLGGVIAGGLLWAGFRALPTVAGYAPANQGVLIGVSGGVFAVTAYYIADKLREEFRAMFFLTVEGYWILGIAAAISVGGVIFTEIPLTTGLYHDFAAKHWPGMLADPIGHSAHLAGIALGFAWRRIEIRFPEIRASRTRKRFAILDKTATVRRVAERKFPSAGASSAPAPAPTSAELRHQVDRILDKINAKGFGSLSPDERALLEKARETLNR